MYIQLYKHVEHTSSMSFSTQKFSITVGATGCIDTSNTHQFGHRRHPTTHSHHHCRATRHEHRRTRSHHHSAVRSVPHLATGSHHNCRLCCVKHPATHSDHHSTAPRHHSTSLSPQTFSSAIAAYFWWYQLPALGPYVFHKSLFVVLSQHLKMSCGTQRLMTGCFKLQLPRPDGHVGHERSAVLCNLLACPLIRNLRKAIHRKDWFY